MIALSRTDRSAFAEWWWSIDRTLLSAVLILIGVGFLMSLAASPAAAGRLSLDDPFHFLYRLASGLRLCWPCPAWTRGAQGAWRLSSCWGRWS